MVPYPIQISEGTRIEGIIKAITCTEGESCCCMEHLRSHKLDVTRKNTEDQYDTIE